MMTIEGRILARAGSRALIRIQPASACGACGSRGGCAAGKARQLWAEVADGLVAGDSVRLTMPAAALNRAALVGYLLPAVATLAGALSLSAFGDAVAALGAGIGLAFGMVAVRMLGRRLARHDSPLACGTDSPSLPGVLP